MIILGIILLVVGLLVPGLHLLFVLGAVLLVVGAVLAVAANVGPGYRVGGRRHWF